MAADGLQITNYKDLYIGDLDPVIQDDMIRRANSPKSNLIHNIIKIVQKNMDF